MNTIARLFFDRKDPEIVSQPHIGIIFQDFLQDLFGLRRGISGEDDLQTLQDISYHLVMIKDDLYDKEHIIQIIGYTLLTIYSMDPVNCDILESSYHYLSLLIVSLPALNGWDSISAVLTTLNYVCQCIDAEIEIPIIALCAAVTVMTKNTLNCQNIYTQKNDSKHDSKHDSNTNKNTSKSTSKNTTTSTNTNKNTNLTAKQDIITQREEKEILTQREILYQQLDATCSSFEAIIRGQAKYALIIIKYGMLKAVLCEPLSELNLNLNNSSGNSLLGNNNNTNNINNNDNNNYNNNNNNNSLESALPVFIRVIDFMSAVHRRGPPSVENIKKSGFYNEIHRFISTNSNSSSSSNSSLNLNSNANSNSNNTSHNTAHLDLSKRLLQLLEGLVTADSNHSLEGIRCILKLLDVLIPSHSGISSSSSSSSNAISNSGSSSSSGFYVPSSSSSTSNFNSSSSSSLNFNLNSNMDPGSVDKIFLLCQTLSRIIEGSTRGLAVWTSLQGLQFLITLLARLNVLVSTVSPTVHTTVSASIPLSGSGSGPGPGSGSGSSSKSRNNLSKQFKQGQGQGQGNSSRQFPNNSDRNNENENNIENETEKRINMRLETIIALTNCIASSFTLFSNLDKNIKDYEISRIRFRKNYSLLADAMVATNIFVSVKSEWGVQILFGLLRGRVDIPDYSNYSSATATATATATSSSSSSSFSAPSSSSSSISRSNERTKDSNSGSGSGSNMGRTFQKSSSSASASSSHTTHHTHTPDRIINPECVEVIIEILLKIPSHIGVQIIEILRGIAERSITGKNKSNINF